MQHRRQNTRHASLMTLDSQPGQPSRNRGADRRIEPQRTAASLASIPDRDDLLRVRDRLALGLGALRLLRCPRGARSRSCALLFGPMDG